MLDYAAQYNISSYCLALLLRHCESSLISEKDNNGSTPLHYAAKYGHKDKVEILLQGGANYMIQNNDNQLAKNLAFVCDEIECYDLLCAWEDVYMLNHIKFRSSVEYYYAPNGPSHIDFGGRDQHFLRTYSYDNFLGSQFWCYG